MAFTRSGVRSPSPPLSGGRRTSLAGSAALPEAMGALVAKGWAPILQWLPAIAGIAQLVEHNLAKVGVAGSSPVSRSDQYETELGG